MINIKNLDLNKIMTDEKSYKNTLITLETVKDRSYTVNSTNNLDLIIGK